MPAIEAILEVLCDQCLNTGKKEPDCPVCGGVGLVDDQVICPACGGEPCPKCTPKSASTVVAIPGYISGTEAPGSTSPSSRPYRAA